MGPNRRSNTHYRRRGGTQQVPSQGLTRQDKLTPPTESETIRGWLTNPGSPEVYIVPYAGHSIMIEAGEIVCDVINDFIIQLEPHLSHAWQLAYSAGEKWSLKNEQKVVAS
jgi:hypothetical protein